MIEKEERIKRYLERVSILDKQTVALQAQLDRLCADEEKALRLTKGDAYTLERLRASNACLREDMLRTLTRLSAAKRGIYRVLERIEQDDVRLVMTERYMNGKTWENIAYDNAYSLSTVYRIHKKGLQAAQELLPRRG